MKIRNYLQFLPVVLAIAGLIALTAKATKQASSLKPPPSDGNSVLGKVVRVADGDTLTAMISGQKTKIRLCGIDAPEKAQELGAQSKAALTQATLNKEVAIVAVDRDRYGRVVAEIFVPGPQERFVNSDIVEQGLAYHYAQYSGSCPNKAVIAAAEAIAKQQHRGVWNGGNHQKPWEYRSSQR